MSKMKLWYESRTGVKPSPHQAVLQKAKTGVFFPFNVFSYWGINIDQTWNFWKFFPFDIISLLLTAFSFRCARPWSAQSPRWIWINLIRNYILGEHWFGYCVKIIFWSPKYFIRWWLPRSQSKCAGTAVNSQNERQTPQKGSQRENIVRVPIYPIWESAGL